VNVSVIPTVPIDVETVTDVNTQGTQGLLLAGSICGTAITPGMGRPSRTRSWAFPISVATS
jgi:hypothetical protein